MGDRCNWGFKEEDGKPVVFLYGHWAGRKRHTNLASALQRAKPRWTDDSYATRICISQLVGEDWNDETGWGIWVGDGDRILSDNQPGRTVPVVNWRTSEVEIYTPCGEKEYLTLTRALDFKEFIAKAEELDENE